MAKLKSTVSPKGVLSWPYIGKPDTRYNAEGVYKTNLICSEADAKPLMDLCEEVFIDEFGKAKLAKASMPFDREIDEDGNETGNISFKFKSKRMPNLYDAKGKQIKKVLQVSSGTIAKVATALNPYNAGGSVGVSMYLNDVQIIELVEYKGGGSKFATEDGFEFSDEDFDEAPAREMPGKPVSENEDF